MGKSHDIIIFWKIPLDNSIGKSSYWATPMIYEGFPCLYHGSSPIAGWFFSKIPGAWNQRSPLNNWPGLAWFDSNEVQEVQV